MADERDEFALLNFQIEILDDHRLAFRRRINLCEVRQLDVVAHELTFTDSSFCSCLRIGVLRQLVIVRGMFKSSGLMSGKISFLVMAVWRSCFELSMNSTISRRSCLKCGSRLMDLRSRGRGISTVNDGPSVAPGPAVSGMIRSAR